MAEVIERVLIQEQELSRRVEELSAEINRDYRGKKITLIGILKGCVPFLADILRRIEGDVEIDFMAISSYGDGTESSGNIRIRKDLDIDIRGKDVLIVEDIIDSGRTLSWLIGMLSSRGVGSLRICALLDKKERRKVPVEADYIGFEIDDEFVVGYGLDYAERYRNLPYVGVLRCDNGKSN